MSKVELKNISKIYNGNTKVVDNVCLTIENEEFVVLVGPSGCGKSTTLRMIAGLEDISGGELIIDDEIMNDIEPKDRNIAMVFQNYALYPHMTVYENMAFGLTIKKISKDIIDQRVREAAHILDITQYLDRKPKALSGGQRQRVAVGRAIVRQPKVFLFDEPLSNLDAKLRVQMRAEIIALHSRLSATIVYVTHDQVEAMTMGDKIVVMKDGVVQQIGEPIYVYNHPVNKFVAGFIGSPPMNFIKRVLLNREGALYLDKVKIAPEHEEVLRPYVGKEIIAGIRPEDFILATDTMTSEIAVAVTMVEPLGGEINLHLAFENSEDKIIASMRSDNTICIGDKISLNIRPEKIKYFDTETENALLDKTHICQ